MMKDSKFIKGDRVVLVSGRHGDNDSNPVYGGMKGKVGGTIIYASSYNPNGVSSMNTSVQWDNGKTNSYYEYDLGREEVSSKVSEHYIEGCGCDWCLSQIRYSYGTLGASTTSQGGVLSKSIMESATEMLMKRDLNFLPPMKVSRADKIDSSIISPGAVASYRSPWLGMDLGYKSSLRGYKAEYVIMDDMGAIRDKFAEPDYKKVTIKSKTFMRKIADKLRKLLGDTTADQIDAEYRFDNLELTTKGQEAVLNFLADQPEVAAHLSSIAAADIKKYEDAKKASNCR